MLVVKKIRSYNFQQRKIQEPTFIKFQIKLQYEIYNDVAFSCTQSTGSFCCWCSHTALILIINQTYKQVHWGKSISGFSLTIKPSPVYSGLISFGQKSLDFVTKQSSSSKFPFNRILIYKYTEPITSCEGAREQHQIEMCLFSYQSSFI